MSQSPKDVRNGYSERFGNQAMEWACRKANWHKARAQKLGLELHFSAWQWLDLCESNGWRCAYCEEQQPLEPHHRHELHKGGLNSIENLDAICKVCHEHIHQWPDDVSDAWMTFQSALLDKFRRVALQSGAVRLSCGTREENQSRCRGILMEFHAPRSGRVPLRGLLPRGEWATSEPVAAINELTQDWWDGRASAQVQWHAGGLWEERVYLSHLAPVGIVLPVGKVRNLSPKKQNSDVQFALAF